MQKETDKLASSFDSFSLKDFSHYLGSWYTYFFPGNNQQELSHRKRTTFKANNTASLALPDKINIQSSKCSIDKTEAVKLAAFSESIVERMRQLHLKQLAATSVSEISNIVLEKVELVAPLIKEHASRRVDLFFYLLVALFGTNVMIEKSNTIKQHGGGNNSLGTQACHSSLFPNLKIEPYSQWSFFTSSKPFSLEGTYFAEALNMTVELPQIVNVFDGMLEGKKKETSYVTDLVKILNAVAMKSLTPLQGMQKFFQIMTRFFDDFETKHTAKTELVNLPGLKKIWEYEKNGTFLGKANYDLTINEGYLFSLLRVFINDKNFIKNTNFLEQRYKLIQNEVLESKPLSKRKKV